jgi:HEAT repeat protein
VSASAELERVASLLGSDDPRERLRGVRTLAGLGQESPSPEERERAAGLLAPLASDPAPFVRWNAALAAGLLGGAGARELLEAEAQVADEHANTRFRVALAIGLLGDPAGLPVLERYVEDPYRIGEHAVVRAFAALALGLLGDPAGIPALARLAEGADPVVRWHAAVSLGDIGHPDGLEALVALTADDVPFVRAHAAIGLAQVGDERGLEAVERVARDEMPRAAQVGSQALELLQRSLAR